MRRITFVAWDGGGNLSPALGIAQGLRQRGMNCSKREIG
jgi:hypothetical protein